MNADGSEVKQLTGSAAGGDDGPAWSPDGKEIAFDSTRDGNFAIYVMEADGSNVRRLTNFPERTNARPAWSPDGNYIAFHAGPKGKWNEYEIYVMNANGSDIRQLTRNKAFDGHPAW